jgi:putative tryptophan/tyrosine transport system substrate-binding protein
MSGMGRREFVALLGGAAAAWPIGARAQQAVVPVIGFLCLASRDTFGYLLDAFRRGLAEHGYVEGKSVTIEYRWADNQADRLPGLAADLVQRQVALIAAVGGLAAPRAAKAATTSIPIVFTLGSDPVKAGLVVSLNRPGGNATGINLFSGLLLTKRLEMARDLTPRSTVVAVLMNPSSPEYGADLADLQHAANSIGQRISIIKASRADELLAAFEVAVQQQATALLVMTDVLFNNRRNELVLLAAQYAVPTIYFQREAVEAGGLMSYGPIIPDLYRQVGAYAGRLLKGDKPENLPVLQPTKFELAINLKTAKVLGLDIPATLLARADEVIE